MNRHTCRGLALAAAAVLFTSLAACSSDEETVTDTGPVELVYWQHSYPARDDQVKKFVTQFETAHPGTTVKPQFIPYDQYFSKLTTALQSGTGPDLFQVPEEMAEQLTTAQAIAPVPEATLTTAAIDEQFVPSTIARWKKDGKYYALPTDVQTVLLFANDKLLKECGGNPAALPRTWAELSTAAQDCTKRNGNGDITQAGLDTSYKWAVYTQAVYSTVNGPIYNLQNCTVNLDQPDVQQAWTTAADFITGPTASSAANFLPGKNSFVLGKAVFHINHPVTIGTLKTSYPDVDFSVGQPPTPDGAPKSLVHSWAYVVNAQSKHVEQAWQFSYALPDDAAQKQWFTATGSLPATNKVLDDPATATDDIQKIALESLKGSRNVETVPVDPDNVTDAAWDAIATKSQTVAEALTDAKKQIDPQIKQTLGCQ